MTRTAVLYIYFVKYDRTNPHQSIITDTDTRTVNGWNYNDMMKQGQADRLTSAMERDGWVWNGEEINYE